MEFFWVVSEWPNGALAITWTAITVILFGPRNDEAYLRAFIAGNTLATIFAAVILFAILPQVSTFESFSVVLALYLVPAKMVAGARNHRDRQSLVVTI
jgi:Fusaric acid resistance protein family